MRGQTQPQTGSELVKQSWLADLDFCSSIFTSPFSLGFRVPVRRACTTSAQAVRRTELRLAGLMLQVANVFCVSCYWEGVNGLTRHNEVSARFAFSNSDLLCICTLRKRLEENAVDSFAV